MNNIPYMFLDLDGTLNGNFQHENTDIFKFDRVYAGHLGIKENRGDYVSIFKLEILKGICKKFKIRVVIVSSWATCLTTVEKFAKGFDINVVDTINGSGLARGDYVANYVIKNNIENYLIVDDSNRDYDERHAGHCIFPRGRYGLSDINFEDIYCYYANTKKYSYIPTTTKVCPECKSDKLVKFLSLNYKECNDCGKRIEWNLDKGQKSLVSNNRIKNR